MSELSASDSGCVSALLVNNEYDLSVFVPDTPENREYIQMSGSLPDPWESHPSVVLTEPPSGGSLIIL